MINLSRSVITHIETQRDEHPYLLSIAAEVEQVIEQLQERQISTEKALQQLEDKALEVVSLQQARRASDLDNLAFSLSTVLHAHCLPDEDDELAQQLSAYLQTKEAWRFNENLARAVRIELYSIINPLLSPARQVNLKTNVDAIFRMHEINR